MDADTIAYNSFILAAIAVMIGLWTVYHARKQTQLSEEQTQHQKKEAVRRANIEPFNAEKPAPKDKDDADVILRYALGLKSSIEYLDFRGIVQLERIGIKIKLSDIYIKPLLFKESAASAASTIDESGVIVGRDVIPLVEQDDWLTVENWLTRATGIVVLGDPGAGKTSLIKWLAVESCNDLIAESGNCNRTRRMPLIVPLAAYAEQLTTDRTSPLADFISDFCARNCTESEKCSNLIKRNIVAGNCLVLLDGVDEITDDSLRGLVIDGTKQFIANVRLSGVRVVVTSRIIGYRSKALCLDSVEHLILPGFSKAEIKRFVELWMEHFLRSIKGGGDAATHEAESEARKLWREIRGNKSVLRLVSNPLLLTILVLVQHKGAALPDRRIELYEFYVRTLIRSWTLARSLDGMPGKVLDEGEVIKMLAPLAYWMHQERPNGVVERNDLLNKISSIEEARRGISRADAHAYASEFLDKVERVSGILVEKGLNQIGFLHYTFQEYFAAREIVLAGQVDRESIVAEVAKRAIDPNWQEVVLLCVGYVGIVAREELLVSKMLQGIIQTNSDQLNRDVVTRCLVAARALRDIGANAVSGPVGISIITRLVEFLGVSEVTLPEKVEVGDLLGSLGDPRLALDAIIPSLVPMPPGNTIIGSNQNLINKLTALVKQLPLKPEHEWLRQYWIDSLLSEVPERVVSVGQFRIGRYPVTNEQYRKFLEANPEHPVPFATEDEMKTFNYSEREVADYQWDVELKVYPAGRGNHPVVLVSWHDALAYVTWLSKISGRKFRLPQEVEWESACKGISGMEIDREGTKVVLTNCSEDGIKRTSAVGSFAEVVSACGAIDLLGQVWEWTSTIWEGTMIIADNEVRSRMQNNSTNKLDCTTRVVKGGSWDDSVVFARPAARGPNEELFKSHYIGFRVFEEIESGT